MNSGFKDGASKCFFGEKIPRFLVSDRSRPDFWGLRPIAGCWLASAVPLGSGWLREADWRSERRPQRARQHNPQPRHNLTNHYPPQPSHNPHDRQPSHNQCLCRPNVLKSLKTQLIIIIQTVLPFKKRSSVLECFPINPDDDDGDDE